jgi:hypothetical protein
MTINGMRANNPPDQKFNESAWGHGKYYRYYSSYYQKTYVNGYVSSANKSHNNSVIKCRSDKYNVDNSSRFIVHDKDDDTNNNTECSTPYYLSNNRGRIIYSAVDASRLYGCYRYYEFEDQSHSGWVNCDDTDTKLHVLPTCVSSRCHFPYYLTNGYTRYNYGNRSTLYVCYSSYEFADDDGGLATCEVSNGGGANITLPSCVRRTCLIRTWINNGYMIEDGGRQDDYYAIFKCYEGYQFAANSTDGRGYCKNGKVYNPVCEKVRISTRLSNQTDGSYHVQVSFDNQTWGSVCDDRWGYSEAQVLCKTIGYKFGTPVSLTNKKFNFFMTNVSCNENDYRNSGSDTSGNKGYQYLLEDCGFRKYNLSDPDVVPCDTSENAGVRCYNDEFEMDISINTDKKYTKATKKTVNLGFKVQGYKYGEKLALKGIFKISQTDVAVYDSAGVEFAISGKMKYIKKLDLFKLKLKKPKKYKAPTTGLCLIVKIKGIDTKPYCFE